MGLSNRDKTTIEAIVAKAMRKGKADSTPIGPTAQELEDVVTIAVAKAVDEMFGSTEEAVVIDVPVVDVPVVPAVALEAPGGRGVIDTPAVTALPDVPPLEPLAPFGDEV